MEEIKIKYFDKNMIRLKKMKKGDWLDLRVSTVEVNGLPAVERDGKYKNARYNAGDTIKIGLGVAMELPSGYEANIVPRSSTYKHYGLIQVNSYGVVDFSYNGDDDEWFFVAHALKPGEIKKNDRVCQFRLNKKMPPLNFNVVEILGNENRGGHGSTGRQ